MDIGYKNFKNKYNYFFNDYGVELYTELRNGNFALSENLDPDLITW